MLMKTRCVYPFRSMQPPKLAMVVVDLQEGCRGSLACASVPVREAIERTCSVISAVRGMGMPIILVCGESTPQPLAEIAKAAGPGAPRFTKSLQSAFTIAPFRRFLDESLTGSLIVAGWVRSICVRDTMLDAIWRGYPVACSEDMLFHRKGFPALDALMPHERLFFCHLVEYHETAGELVRSIMRTRYQDGSG